MASNVSLSIFSLKYFQKMLPSIAVIIKGTDL